ncbi:hypothetical protein ACQPYE_27890 [Actinosynnema sp. CA-299493]
MWVEVAMIGAACGPVTLGVVAGDPAGTNGPQANGGRPQVPYPETGLWSWPSLNALGTRDGFMVGAVVGVGLVVLHQRFDGVPHQLAVLWLAAIGVPLMMIDWACHRLPAPLVRALFAGGVAILGYVAASHDDLNALIRALLAVAITSAASLTVAMIIPAALGAGDVKLLGAVALYLGWVGWLDLLRGVVLALLLGATAGTTLLITRRISRTDRLAFGPAIVGGALLALVTP